jgi:hypothetical protein
MVRRQSQRNTSRDARPMINSVKPSRDDVRFSGLRRFLCAPTVPVSFRDTPSPSSRGEAIGRRNRK